MVAISKRETEGTQTLAWKATKIDNNRAASIPAHPIVLSHNIIIVHPLPLVAIPMKIIGSTIIRTVVIKSVTPTTL